MPARPLPKELILLRHAKADYPAIPVRDYQRPLSEFGFSQAVAIANWLETQNIRPGLILVSGANRTLQTIQPWRDAHPDTKVIELESLYGATPGEILAQVDAQTTALPILVVGHNPGMEYCLRYLLGKSQTETEKYMHMRPGDLAQLGQTENKPIWQPGEAELIRYYSALRD